MEAAGLQEYDRAATGCAFFSRPNCSLNRHQQNLVVFVVAIPCVGMGLFLASLGYWLVLPFAGFEVGLLVWAFAQLREHDDDYESIAIRGDEVHLEWRNAGALHRRQMNAAWTRVEDGSDAAAGPGRFCLRSHGVATELGRYLCEEERIEVAKTLRARLRRTAFEVSHT